MKVVETMGIQKKVLEDENDELKSRISELMVEREMSRSILHRNVSNGIPPLNLSKSSGRLNP